MKSLWRIKEEEERVLFHFFLYYSQGCPPSSPLLLLFLPSSFFFLLGLLTGFPLGQTRRPLIWHKRKEEGTAVKVGKGSKWRKRRKWSVSLFGDEGKTDLGSAEMRMIGLASRRIQKYLNYFILALNAAEGFPSIPAIVLDGNSRSFSRPFIYFPLTPLVGKLFPLRLIFSRLEDNSKEIEERRKKQLSALYEVWTEGEGKNKASETALCGKWVTLGFLEFNTFALASDWKMHFFAMCTHVGFPRTGR